MRLSTDEILKNSLVVTIDDERVQAFNQRFLDQGLPLPKKFIGYEIEEDFLLRHFQMLRKLKREGQDKILHQQFKLIKYLCNNASQWSVVQFAKNTNMPFVTIFEDDADPVDNVREKLDLLCSDIPDETDVLRLGYCTQFPRPTTKGMTISALPHSDNLIVKNLSGAQAYIVFARYYDRFITTNKHQPRTDFNKINPSRDKNVFALKESLFNQVNLPDRPVLTSWKFKDGHVKVNC